MLAKFTSVGSYPLFYTINEDTCPNATHDAVYCATCAAETDEFEAHGEAALNPHINPDHASLFCDGCFERIESAYAEEEEDDCAADLGGSKCPVETVAEWSVCGDCLHYIVNGDPTGLSYHLSEDEVDKTIETMDKSLSEAGGHAVYGDKDLGFCRSSCDCCRSDLHGDRHRIVILATGGE